MKTLNQILHPAFSGRVDKMKKSQSYGYFDNVGEFLEATREPTEYSKGRWNGVVNNSTVRFAGCEYPEAIKRLETGYQDAIADIDNLIIEIPETIKPVTRKRKKKRGDFGEEYDILRAWSGNLDTAWQSMERRAVQGPATITIAANQTINARTDKSVLFWRGAAAVALTDMLEKAGYRVEILSLFVVRSGNPKNGQNGPLFLQIKSKASDMPLDKGMCAAALANSAFLRVNFFQWACCQDDWFPAGDIGQMRSTEQYAAMAPGTIGDLEQVKDASSAARWIENSLEKIQVETALVV